MSEDAKEVQDELERPDTPPTFGYGVRPTINDGLKLAYPNSGAT
jgi:hypothetical protein